MRRKKFYQKPLVFCQNGQLLSEIRLVELTYTNILIVCCLCPPLDLLLRIIHNVEDSQVVVRLNFFTIYVYIEGVCVDLAPKK